MPRPKSKSSGTDSRPAKRTKLQNDNEASDSDTGSVNGVALPNVNGDNGGFKINAEYAKRFEHNKKREEEQQLEEKYKKTGKRPSDSDDSEEDSESESEDDDAELVTEELDHEIFETLKAIKSKDPRVYDKDSKFYRPIEETLPKADVAVKEKPMYLKDYHRQNLLEGGAGDEEEATPPQTYAQEQEALKKNVVGQMHATTNGDDGVESDNDDFLVKKAKSTHDAFPDARPQKKTKKKALDIEGADKDPETYLSNFMNARAWLPEQESGSRFEAFNSDDSEEEERAEGWEAAYNLRFENPQHANEKLTSYSRDIGKHSARREELSGRQKQREKERAEKENRKQARREEKARLRNLKMEEMERKVKQIREAAGLRADDVLDLEEWKKVLEEDWDDERWEAEMERRFNDKYYADKGDIPVSDNDSDVPQTKKSKTKKPKWDDDIDIKDLVPEFSDGEEKADFSLSDADDNDDEEKEDDKPTVADDADEMSTEEAPSKSKSKKDHKQALADKKRAARKQRLAISELVDETLTTDLLPVPTSSKAAASRPAAFRYRETSPANFGLTARDILFADDTQLNQFAGLKKMAAFRDAEKKKRDRKALGKKARLRQWRRETFGNEEGFRGEFADYVRAKGGDVEASGANAARRGEEKGKGRSEKGDQAGEGGKGRKRKSRA